MIRRAALVLALAWAAAAIWVWIPRPESRTRVMSPAAFAARFHRAPTQAERDRVRRLLR